MPSIQDTIYSRMKSSLTDKDLEEAYTPKRKEMEWVERKTRGNVQQLALVILLKATWKRKTTPLLDLSWIPEAWWKWLTPKGKKESMPEEINRRHFENVFSLKSCC